MLIKKNTTITIADGTNAANDFVTVGGTPAGILITHPFFVTNAKICTARNAQIIPTKIPFDPTQPSGIPLSVTSPSVTSNGIRMNHATTPTAAPASLSIFNCPAKEYPIPSTAKIAMISNVAFVGFDINAVQFSPKNCAQNSVQCGIGKFAINMKNDPTINSGVVRRKPSRIAVKYLFFPKRSATGTNIFSNLSNISIPLVFAFQQFHSCL